MKKSATFLKSVCLILVLAAGIPRLSAQTQKMDSLLARLNAATSDTSRLQLYLKLSNECVIDDNLKYAEPAVKLADKLLAQTKDSTERKKILRQKASAFKYCSVYYQHKEGSASSSKLDYLQKSFLASQEASDPESITDALLSLGDCYFFRGDILKKLECLQKGFSLTKQMNFKRGESRFIMQIGFLYADQNDTVQALNYLEKGMNLEKEIGDSTRLSRGYFITGNFYAKMRRFNQALEFYAKAVQRYESSKDTGALINLYQRTADSYIEKQDLSNALKYTEKTFALAETVHNLPGVFFAYITFGNIYRRQGDFEKAVEFHQKANQFATKVHAEEGIAVACGYLAKDYFLLKDYKTAKKNSDLSLELTKKTGAVQQVFETESLAYKIDSAAGNFKDAFSHYQQYFALKDQLNTEAIHKAATRERFQTESEKQKASFKAEQDKKDVIAAEEKKRQQLFTFAVAGALLLVLAFSTLLYKRFRLTSRQKLIIEIKSRETEMQKQLIEEKQHEIIDSITYAKRLQQAILPSVEAVKEQFPDSFVYYQPKDIVAGDFYWMHSTPEAVYLAAADCTGHGVPGSMVSVVCSNALNRAVNEFKLTDTGNILDKTRELVIETFEKSDSEVNDGMDISLLKVSRVPNESKEIHITWSGANNSLWYVLNNELTEVKANKQPIGKYREPKPFTTNTIILRSPVSVYLFSDGYADQFSPGDKKLMKKKFKDIILSLQNLTMNEQMQHLDAFHTGWKGVMEQTDDVLVIGVKL
jgi:tetratricopeptide (TPR) repeat protein